MAEKPTQEATEAVDAPVDATEITDEHSEQQQSERYGNLWN